MAHEHEITRLNERVKVYLAPSKIHGVGVFALRDIAKGQKLYVDDMPEVYSVPFSEFGKLFPEVAGFLLSKWPGVVVGQRFAFPTDRVMGHMNHSDDPNYDPVSDTLLRDVQKGEEITEDYRIIRGYQQAYPWLLDK